MGMIVSVLIWALQIYSFVLLARVIISWIPDLDRNNQIIDFLFQITEPVLQPVRNALPPMSGIDLSPLVVFIGISIVQQMIAQALL